MTASGRTSRCSPRWPSASSCACSTTRAAARSEWTSPRSTGMSGTASCPDRSGAAVRLPGARPARPRGGAAVQPGQAAARPLRQGASTARSHGTPPSTATRWAATTASATTTDSAPFVPVGGHQPVVRVGRRPPAAHPLARDRAVRGHVKGLTHAPPGDPAGPARHLRGHGASRRDRAPAPAGRHRGGADAGPSLRPRPLPDRPGPAQLLGLQLDRLLRPAQRVLGVGRRAGRLASSGTW